MAKTVTGGGKREQIQGIQGEVEVESVVTAREAPPENQSTKNLIIIRNANGNKSYGKDNLFLELKNVIIELRAVQFFKGITPRRTTSKTSTCSGSLDVAWHGDWRPTNILLFWFSGYMDTHNVICILHLSTKAVNGPMRGNVFIFPATIPPDYGSLKKDMRIVQCYVFTFTLSDAAI